MGVAGQRTGVLCGEELQGGGHESGVRDVHSEA